MATTWIVGDVHGCGAELNDLLDRLALTAGDRPILVGDLLDKGPDPVKVLDTLREAGAEAVLGNHDVAVRDHGRARLEAPRRARRAKQDRMAAFPAKRGSEDRPGLPPGRSTGMPREPAPYVVACLDRLAAAGRLEEAVALCSSLPVYLRGDGFVVVHGGFDPDRGPDETPEHLAVTLREFPPGVPGAPKWWTRWPGPEVAVFGHDARQGFLRHEVDGRPRCIGLDSGLVYGGRLSAWSPERDVLVQVPARRVWHPKATRTAAP